MKDRYARAASVVAAIVLGLVVVGTAISQSPPTIPLPSDLKLDAPAAAVPESIARFSGAWAHGAWDGVLPHVLVVESVDGTGRAQVVYALGDFAEGNVSRAYRRVTGRIEGDELHFDPSRSCSSTTAPRVGALSR